MPTADQVAAEIDRALRTYAIPVINTGLAGSYGTFWTGTYPGSAGRACDDTTAGALFPVPSNDTARLAFAEAPFTGSTTNLFLTDRVVDVSGLVANSTALQAISAPALGRHTDGAGVMPWLETVTAATTPPACNATLVYTNSAGTTGQTSVAPLPLSWASTARRSHPLNLAPGDIGVRSVQSLTLNGAAATAGNVALVLAKLIQYLPHNVTSLTVGQYQRRPYVNAVRGGLPRIRAGACVHAFAIGGLPTLGAVLLQVAVTELLG